MKNLENSKEYSYLCNEFKERVELNEYVDESNIRQFQLFLNVGDKENNDGIVELFSLPNDENNSRGELFNTLLEHKCINIKVRAKNDGITPQNIHLFHLDSNGIRFVK